MELLDCFLTYGRPAAPSGRPYLSPDELVAEMDQLGIAECWCADFRALENSAALGNRLLLEELRGYPRLHPVWIVLPPWTREMAAEKQLLSALDMNGVHMVRAAPERHGFSIAEWCCGPLWAALESCGVPVLLSVGKEWGELETMLSAHPGLPTILSDVGYRSARMLYPLLERHNNLRVETSTLAFNEALPEIVCRFGAERLLFGTGSPSIAPETGLGLIRYSGLADDDISAIAGGNLRRLLGEASARLGRTAQ